jgi:hypothetical protein
MAKEPNWAPCSASATGMPHTNDKALPLSDAGVQSVKAKMTETMLAPKFGYRKFHPHKIERHNYAVVAHHNPKSATASRSPRIGSTPSPAEGLK